MKVERNSSLVCFDSIEEFLDSYVSLSIQLNELGNETADSKISDSTYFKGRKLLWESGFSLQQKLRHELLSVLPKKQTTLHI